MRRVTHPARAEWKSRVERELGFTFHSPGGAPYWDETAHWEFTEAEIDRLDEAAVALHQLCLKACDRVVAEKLYARLGIPPQVAPAVEWSWRQYRAGRGEKPVYGRFDLAWGGGVEPPVMLEYNASTPTSLYEASVVQWHWLEEFAKEADQFNGLHEALVARWAEIGRDLGPRNLHLAAQDTPEDMGTASYMQSVAVEAGLAAKLVPVQDLGFDAREGRFYDRDGVPVEALWTLYPPEWMIQDEYGPALVDAVASGRLWLLEPLWKLMLTKGILPILWEMAPGHPNLLKASFAATDFKPGEKIVAKPLWGREGDGVEIATLGPDGRPAGEVVRSGRERFAGDEGWIYQAYAPLHRDAGGHLLLGVWMVGDEAKGMGLREDAHPITGDGSRFVPHLFR
ncbi:MAG TPA: glutathionylspermidine synthase family protein [Azospirillaceae bacterium]|nr:glutathionylspermidine synthase family protein [Azospirillaceae bacterium]